MTVYVIIALVITIQVLKSSIKYFKKELDDDSDLSLSEEEIFKELNSRPDNDL